jgi:hypothetical protein
LTKVETNEKLSKMQEKRQVLEVQRQLKGFDSFIKFNFENMEVVKRVEQFWRLGFGSVNTSRGVE